MSRVLVMLVLAFVAVPAFGHEPSLAPNRRERADEWFEWSRTYAEQLLAAGRHLEAIEEFSVCAAVKPDDITSTARVAVELVRFGSTPPNRLEKGQPHYEVAKRFIREGVARGGKGDPRLGYAIGRLYLVDGDWVHAHFMFREAVERLEQRDQPYVGIDLMDVKSHYYQAAVNAAPKLVDAGWSQLVVDELSALLAQFPNAPLAPAALINMALAHRRLMETVEAERILRELTTSHPEYGEAWNAYGQILQDQGRNEEALAAYRQSIELSNARGKPHAEALASIAAVLLKLERFEEAAKYVKSFINLERDSPHGLYLLAKIRRGEGKEKEAILLLRRAKRLNWRLFAAYTDLQSLHFGRGEMALAAEVKAELAAAEVRVRREVETAAREASGDDSGDPAPKPPLEPGDEPEPAPGAGEAGDDAE